MIHLAFRQGNHSLNRSCNLNEPLMILPKSSLDLKNTGSVRQVIVYEIKSCQNVIRSKYLLRLFTMKIITFCTISLIFLWFRYGICKAEVLRLPILSNVNLANSLLCTTQPGGIVTTSPFVNLSTS